MKKANPLSIKAIIGLGNPAFEFQETYHNLGANLVDFLTQEKNPNFKKPASKNFCYLKKGKLILIKSLVFMNQSGEAVKEALSYFKLKPQEIALAHDDSDIFLGNYKIAFDQRSAGHKGVQSVIDNLKTQEFWRIKIGIRPEKERIRQKAQELVLKKISSKNQEILKEVFEKIFSFFKLKLED